MNAAFVSLSMSRQGGGLFECMRQLGTTLHSEQAMRVEMLALADNFSDEDQGAWSPLPVRAFPAHQLPAMAVSLSMGKCLRGLEVDLLHTHGLWSYASIVVPKWAERTRRPYIVSPHGMLDRWALLNSGWKKRLAAAWFERAHLERAACLHALCAAEAGSIRDYGLINPICVIPNGVDLPELEAKPGPAPWADRFPSGQKVLLYLGRIHPKKGLPNFLRAWAAVCHQNGDKMAGWMFVVAGWDQNGHTEELRHLACELSIDAMVHFAGPMFGEIKANAYRHAHAFVLPSFSEGLPLVILEAWAHALPVIMTPACNLPEGLSSGAALESAPEPEALASALAKLINASDAERAQIGEKGRALVAQQFTWSSAAAKFAEVYSWMLGKNRQPEFVIV